MTRADRERAARLLDEPLAPEEFARRVAEALAETDEIARQAELVAWFRRRYPTARDRLRYARRKYAEWTRPSTRTAPEG
ncbi:MAG TPA: hypothetical protein VHB21_05100 [Minicystis sp.]|nr:hypothetical protein [Minicystis sp.]